MRTRSTLLRLVVGVVTSALVLVTMAGSATAHDPIFVGDDQTTPDTGPYMPDGSISWALYGSVLADGDTRGFEFDLRDGDEAFVSLLIPNLSPEVDLTDAELPIIELEAPDGTVTVISPEVRDVFDEPFSNTSYVTLAEHREPGQAGRYRGLIVGGAPARFSVAIGETEIFFTETERSGDRPTNFAEITEPLTAWYTTVPGGVQDTSALEDGEAAIDLDMIEDAMESGEAQAPEDSLGDEEATADDKVGDEEPEAQAVEEPTVEESADGESAAVADDDESDVDEVAAAASPSEDGSGTTWVAPAIIGAIAVVGAGAFAMRRKQTS